MRATIPGLVALTVLLGAGCGRPAVQVRAPNSYGLVRDPENFRERGEVRLCIYDIGDLRQSGAGGESPRVVEALVRLCARGESGWSTEVSASGDRLLVTANSGAHRLVRELLDQLRVRPKTWVTSDQWRNAFRHALSGADRAAVGKAEVTGAEEVAAFIASFEFRDSYSGIDCQCRLEPLIRFYGGGRLIGELEYLPCNRTTSLRWIGGPWDGNATLTEASAAWLTGAVLKMAPHYFPAGGASRFLR
jgi:hypothetical protein